MQRRRPRQRFPTPGHLPPGTVDENYEHGDHHYWNDDYPETMVHVSKDHLPDAKPTRKMPDSTRTTFPTADCSFITLGSVRHVSSKLTREVADVVGAPWFGTDRSPRSHAPPGHTSPLSPFGDRRRS